MRSSTLEQLEAAFASLGEDLSERVEYLAERSSAGQLSEDERAEYEQIVKLNDSLAILKLQTQEYWRSRYL